MEKDDFVFYKNKDGNIMSGGYLISSMNNDLTKILRGNSLDTTDKTTIDKSTIKEHSSGQRGGSIIGMLQNLAVPAGLVYLQQTFNVNKKTQNTNSDNTNSNTKNTNKETKVIEPSLYDKLLDMVSVKEKKDSKQNKTRKRKQTKKQSKTKKRK